MSHSEVLEFAAEVLEEQGAIVERTGPGVIDALVPDELRRSLGLEELARLADGRDDGSACGYGTEILRKLAAAAIGSGRVAGLRAECPECQPRSPAGLEGVNVSFRVSRTWSEPCWTLVGFARYTASCDDERLGLVAAAVTAPDGVPVEAPDLSFPAFPLLPIPPSDVPAEPIRKAYPKLLHAIRRDAAVDLEGFREAVARRRARDVARLRRYFDEVRRDLERRIARRESDALQAKLSSIPAELKKRIAQLEAESAVRVRPEIVGLAAVLGPGVRAELEVRRRKHRRTLSVQYCGITRRWAGLRCAGCGAAASAFALCDEAVHVLCAGCWDACGTGGRRRCFRCAGEPEQRDGPVERRAPARTAGPQRSPADHGEMETQGAPEASDPPTSPRTAIASAGGAPSFTGPPAESAEAGADRARGDEIAEVLRRYRVPLTSTEIRSIVSISAEELRKVLRPLIREGRVGRFGERRGTRYYWIEP